MLIWTFLSLYKLKMAWEKRYPNHKDTGRTFSAPECYSQVLEEFSDSMARQLAAEIAEATSQ